jgi:hypothetical protein
MKPTKKEPYVARITLLYTRSEYFYGRDYEALPRLIHLSFVSEVATATHPTTKKKCDVQRKTVTISGGVAASVWGTLNVMTLVSAKWNILDK